MADDEPYMVRAWWWTTGDVAVSRYEFSDGREVRIEERTDSGGTATAVVGPMPDGWRDVGYTTEGTPA